MLKHTLASILLASLACGGSHAQVINSAFTYQGELRSGDVPAEGVFDLRFSLFASEGGSSPIAAEFCADNVQVAGGRFTVVLDFGAAFASGQARFLAVRVREDSAAGCADATGYTTLTPRQPLTATPHASFALASANATTALSATLLNGQSAAFYTNAANLTGLLADGRLSSNVSLRSASQSFTGVNSFTNAANVFSGNGAGLTALNAASLATGTVPEARLPLLGGDVGGAYGAVSVAKLRGIPVASTLPAAGQVLKHNGTQWAPAADLNTVTAAGQGLVLVGSTLGVADAGISGTMLASDDTAIEKVTERFIRWNSNHTGMHLGPPGNSTSATPGVLQVIGGDPNVPIFQVVGFDGSDISLRAGAATFSATSGGLVSIAAGSGYLTHDGGTAEFTSGSGGNTPVSGGSAGDGGRVLIKAGDGGDGRTTPSGKGGHAVIRGGDSPAADSGIRGLGGNVYLIPGIGSAPSGIGINLAEGTTLNANLRIRGNGTLGRMVLESGGTDQVSEFLFSENTTNTAGIYLREDGVANALKVIDLTAGGETTIATFDRDTNGFSAGIKAFRIDHPLDPFNKTLSHSCVESPDMMNIYNGTILTDAAGYATIELPSYFSVLNRDFRYQLTVIDPDDVADEFVLAKVVRKIGAEAPNQFTIRTSRGGTEVSWQVTGVRQDALAQMHRIVPEAEKRPSEKGHLLNPDAFAPTTQSVVD